mgnify:CR=1 FL=1
MAQHVTVKDLVSRPREFHERRITVRGLWSAGFERSAFAGAWLRPPESWTSHQDFEEIFVRVTGTWRVCIS